MFGIIRTLVLLVVAFFAGLVFERSQAAEACAQEGGEQVRGICRGLAR